MRVFTLNKLVFITLITLFITACSSPTVSDDHLTAQEKEQLTLKKEMLKKSSYLYSGTKILRFNNGRFAIYEDALWTPSSYGVVRLEGDEIHFISKSRQIKNNFDINTTAIRLWADEKENILIRDTQERSFYTPKDLFEAVRFGTSSELKLLIESGASMNEADDLGVLPLSEAIYHGREDLIPLMIENKADILAEDANGHTALHAAIEAKSLAMVRLLLEHGAQSQLKECSSFLDVLEKDESFGMSRILIESGFNTSCEDSKLLFWVLSSELLAKKNQTLSSLEYLLRHNIKVDVVSPELGDTPLMRAAAVGNDMLVKRLVEYGIDIYAKDRLGRTALDYDSLYLSEKNEKISALLHGAGLHTGLKAEADALYKSALALHKAGKYNKAYKSFKALAEKYKQKRLYQAKVNALRSMRNIDMKMLKELIDTFAYLNHDESELFYTSMIGFYKKMEPLSHRRENLDVNGNYEEGSVWYVYDKIDRLYRALHKKYPKTKYLYGRWLNYKKFKNLRSLKRRDMKNREGIRFVGETVDGIPFGKGALHFVDGSKYYGHVFNFMRHGKGRITYVNGQIYDGEWVDDKREGKGFFTDETNALYLGTFHNDQQTGDKKLVRSSH